MGAREGGRRQRRPKKKVCAFCIEKAGAIDYKDINKQIGRAHV